MKLKDLNLISFGKFKNKIIQVDNGLNIIYGENESGKTTIHNFIEGIFYGFLKPHAQRRNFLEELDKYRPWHQDQYSGIVTLEKDNKDYRIERDFNREIVKVYDEDTGKDITDSIDTGERLKIHLPGLYFFGFNSLVYRNTIAIRQLNNKVDHKLAKEVKDRLVNISTSMDDEISVKNALASLNNQLKEIGTERAYTKDYGKARIELEELRTKRKEALEKKKEYNQTLERYMDLKKEIDQMEFQLRKDTYDEAIYIMDRLSYIDQRIKNLSYYGNISKEDYYEAVKIHREIELINIPPNPSNELERIKEEKEKAKSRFNLTSILTIVLLGLFIVHPAIPLLAIFTGGLAIRSLTRRKELDKEIISIEEKIKTIKAKENRKEELTNSLNDLLERNRAANLGDFKIGLENKNQYDDLLKEKENKKDLLDRVLKDTSLDRLEAKLSQYDDKAFDNNIVSSQENLSFKREEYSKLQERIDNLSKYVSDLVTIEDHIDRTENQLKDMDQYKDSINIAIEVIENVSEKIHSQFAPDINRRVSNIIKKITDGRYNNVRIDDNLNVTIENPKTRQIVPLYSLSGGTIDQIYFALRFSIIHSIGEGNFPLILDDCFIQYDNNRLENVLKYLDEVSNTRQILLFTCHRREKEILDRLNLKYNFINIC